MPGGGAWGGRATMPAGGDWTQGHCRALVGPETLPRLPNSGGQAAALETRSLDEGEKENRSKLRNLTSIQILPKVNFSEKGG